MNLEFRVQFQADRSSKMKPENWPEFSNVEVVGETLRMGDFLTAPEHGELLSESLFLHLTRLLISLARNATDMPSKLYAVSHRLFFQICISVRWGILWFTMYLTAVESRLILMTVVKIRYFSLVCLQKHIKPSKSLTIVFK